MFHSAFFHSNKPIDTSSFENVFFDGKVDDEITYLSEDSLLFRSSFAYSELEEKLERYSSFETGNTSLILCHSDDDFCKKMAKEGASYFPNRVVYLSDVLFKFIALGDYSFIPSLKNYFRSIDPSLLETAGSYLRNGLDASKGAKELKIHRNTMNYRLFRFVELTSLDLRDYHNALFLELYFQLIA